MTPDVVAELNKAGEPTDFHAELLTYALGLVKMSRSKMSRFYDSWDLQDQVYRGERYLDNDDVEQAKKDKPIKMVVPNTFAQVMTFTSFLFLMFKQNRTFFELTPTGASDYGTKEADCEIVMERDLQHNKWNSVLFQHLLDVGRFGPSILECSWTRKLSHAYVTPETNVVNYNSANVNVRENSSWQEFVKYEGNLVRSVSPYRFFPDTRFPLTEFQRGEFCAAEEEYSLTALRGLADSNEVAGIDQIQPLGKNLETSRGGPTRATFDLTTRRQDWVNGPSKSEGIALVTKMQIWLVPSKFKFGSPEKKLGPEEFPVLYHLWYANDNRIIRCEPAYWWHNEFGWTISQFTPDMHQTLSLGLADLIYRLQDVITWHINARITDVRRNMRGRLVVDPAGIDTSTLDGEGDIYMRKSASKSGVDRWLKQLNMVDTTQGHMADADTLSKIMEVVTGVNGNAMGQYNSGRRSAQESRTVTAGAAGRMKLHGYLIWSESMGPLGRMMLSNSRQSLSKDMYRRTVGLELEELEARFAAFHGDPQEVIGADDYFNFDSTLASEKGFIAQNLQQLLTAIIGNPVAAQQLDIDPRAILDEVQRLQGAGPVSRFSLSKRIATGQAAPLPPIPVPGQPPQQGAA